MLNELLNHEIAWWFFYIVVLVSISLLVKFALFLGRKYGENATQTQKTQVQNAANAMLALTAFLLAISFSIAEHKFSTRKDQVFKEANAVGTVYLRSFFLDKPNRLEVESLLRNYITTRLEAVETHRYLWGADISEGIHRELWKIAVSAGAKKQGSLERNLFVEAVNEMIDLAEERLAVGLYQEMPQAMLSILIFSVYFTMILLSFSFGAKGTKSFFIPMGPTILFTLILLLIVDLAQTRQRFFSVDQQPIQDTLDMIDGWKGDPFLLRP